MSPDARACARSSRASLCDQLHSVCRDVQRRGWRPRSERCVRVQAVDSAKKGSKPPSMQSSATELEALEAISIVVPDTWIMEETSLLEKPKAATVSPNVLAGILNNPAGLRPYKNAIENAMAYDKQVDRVLDKALANVGALFAEKVDGRVATEIDPRLAHDTGRMVAQAQHLLELYTEMRVPNDKLIFQFPGTWEGIQAARQLESEGVATLVSLVYSFSQAVAAAQASVSVVMPSVGRLQDWYKANPGVIRDPKGPREDSGYSSLTHPGRELVKRIYNYCHKYHRKTLVMASSIRTKEDALAIAGCDFIVMGPTVLRALDDTPTAMGYND
eukprot:evm.model.scf_3304.1 EVM.evm.TU.scf_3304.1   scf_3304:10-2913(-)